MSYKLKKKYANKNNYGAKRSTSNIKYIVIHYTANDGDTDEGNANYFASRIIKASAHYFVDDDSVTQSVPDNYVAWSVGGSKYNNCKTTGGGKYYTKCTNSNSISIELCDTKKDGKIYPTKKTIDNAIELTRKLMKKYNIPYTNVIRHFDVTGKTCPAYWCGTSENNKLWKTEFHNKLSISSSTPSNLSSPTSKKVNKPTIAKPTLKNGSKGTQVKYLQQDLNYLGFKGTDGKQLTIDGVIGNNVIYALKQFQIKYKLSVDGVYGDKSYAKMKALLG